MVSCVVQQLSFIMQSWYNIVRGALLTPDAVPYTRDIVMLIGRVTHEIRQRSEIISWNNPGESQRVQQKCQVRKSIVTEHYWNGQNGDVIGSTGRIKPVV